MRQAQSIQPARHGRLSPSRVLAPASWGWTCRHVRPGRWPHLAVRSNSRKRTRRLGLSPSRLSSVKPTAKPSLIPPAHSANETHSRKLVPFVISSAGKCAGKCNSKSNLSNSSGSVVNQAVQVTPSAQHKYHYGSGITCDGPTLNISPFLSTTNSWAQPWEETYNEPVYDNSDNFGLIDPETGLNGPDGIPDSPGRVLFYKPIRTAQKSNFSINGGITATISIPLGREPIELCKQAARRQVQLYEQALADKRLNYEIARLKACSDRPA